ncbi:MAG TPA: hypothetical protein DDX03_07810, partial [Firmicutes bacterium]|nr:hypothetical protein [Bacillota bacterium]
MFAVIEQGKWQGIIGEIEHAMKLPGYRNLSTRKSIKCPFCQKETTDYGKLAGGTVPAYLRCRSCGYDSTVTKDGIR